jgi:hypothetical protein
MDCYLCEESGKKVQGTKPTRSGRMVCQECYEEFIEPIDGQLLTRALPQKKATVQDSGVRSQKPARESKGAILDALDDWHKNAAAKPAAGIEEKTKMARVLVDDDKLVELHKQGLTDKEIADGIGCGYVATSAHRRALGLPPNSSGGKPKNGNGTKPLPKVQRMAADRAAETSIELAPALLPASAEVQPGVAVPHRAKARVVMFEIEGGNETILAAIETVKAALQR